MYWQETFSKISKRTGTIIPDSGVCIMLETYFRPFFISFARSLTTATYLRNCFSILTFLIPFPITQLNKHFLKLNAYNSQLYLLSGDVNPTVTSVSKTQSTLCFITCGSFWKNKFLVFLYFDLLLYANCMQLESPVAAIFRSLCFTHSNELIEVKLSTNWNFLF